MIDRLVLVAIGSNIDPEANVPAAIEALCRHDDVVVLGVGEVYRSPAVGRPDDPEFHNSAALLSTGLEISALRDALRGIESTLGRVRTSDEHAPRTIDLDIALVEGLDEPVEIDGTVIPDPEVARFAHLALPLADVAPDWAVPGDGRTLGDIAAALDDQEITRIMSTDDKPAIAASRYASETRMEASPDEVYDPAMEARVRFMLEHLGEDPTREGLLRTPLRVAKAFDFLTSGYVTTLDEIVNNAVFESDADEMVLVRDIEFYSLCEHHMLPFFGKAAVAYLPNESIIGLSKIARIVDMFARRFQVQERLTNQIADAIAQVLDPHGVAVVMEGSHFCMMMRGVQKQGSSMITSAMRGGFKSDARTRAEFLELIKG